MAELSTEQQKALVIAQARLRLQEQGASPEWAGKVAGYKTELADIDRRKPSTAPIEKAAIGIEALGGKAVDVAATMGIRGIPPALGQVVGQRVAGKPGQMAGGAIGGAIGSTADQLRLMAQGAQPNFSWGQFVADVGQGANPARGATKNALANVAAVNAQSYIDQGKLASPKEMSTAAAGGFAGGGLSKTITGKSLETFDDVHRKRLEIARELRKEGVVINPAELRRGSTTMQSIAGKADLGFEASQLNQPVWQRFAREDLGLDKKKVSGFEMKKVVDGKIVDGEIETSIRKGYEPYETIKAISLKARKEGEKYFTAMGGHEKAIQDATAQGQKLITEAAADVDKLKIARHTQAEAYKKVRAGEPGSWEAYEAAKAQVGSLEDAIDLAAQSAGDPKLLERLRNGRKQIAVGYAYLNATDPYTGLVNPKLLTQQFDEDPIRLSGRAAQIAKFEKSFGRNAVEGSQVPAPGVSQIGSNFSMVSAAQGNPTGAAMAGIPLLRQPVRDYMFSDFAQNRYAQPRFQANPEDLVAAFARFAPQAATRQPNFPVEESMRQFLRHNLAFPQAY